MCMGSQSLPPRPRITGQEKEAGEKPKAQDEQSNDKNQDHKDRMDETGFPSKDPCRGSLSGPGKTFVGATRPHQQSEPPLSPPMLDKRIRTGLGRHLHGGMQIFVKTKNSQDQMRTGRHVTLTGIMYKLSKIAHAIVGVQKYGLSF